MSSTDKSLLEQIQEMYLQNLVSLVPVEKKARAMELTEQYTQATRAAASITPRSNRERYAGIQYVIDAIKLYLSDVGKPITEEEVVEGLVGSGFRPLRPSKTRGEIKKSLKQYLTGKASKMNEIRKINGLVGLYEWDEAKFNG